MSAKTALAYVLRFRHKCRRCQEALVSVRSAVVHRPPSEEENKQDIDEVIDEVWSCPRCDWWYALHNERTYQHRIDDTKEVTTYFEGIVKRFEASAPDTPNDVLRRYIAKHPGKIPLIHHKRWELLMKDVYSDFYDCDVRHVGGPCDEGCDLYAVINDKPHLIQIKRREKTGKTEGVSLVREFIGVLLLHGAGHGHIVTTAEEFSRQARAAAANFRLIHHKIAISLKDIADIKEMLCLSNARLLKPWDNLGAAKTNPNSIHYDGVGDEYDWDLNVRENSSVLNGL